MGCDRGAVHDRRPGAPVPVLTRSPGRSALATADRGRERIGGVVRRGDLGQLEDDRHHPGDLPLVGLAVARDAHLDLVGGRLADGNAGLGGGQQHDAARLARRRTRSGRSREKNSRSTATRSGWWVSISSAIVEWIWRSRSGSGASGLVVTHP